MVFVPIAIASLILASLVHVKGKEKNASPKRTPEQQSDELITVILPTLNSDK